CELVGVHLATALVVGFAVLARRVQLLQTPLIVEDGVSGLVVAMGGMFDQSALGLLEALGLSATCFLNWTHCRVALVGSAAAADLGCFSGRLLGLLLLIRLVCTHRLLLSEDTTGGAR